jgi:hypothetical protein
MPSPLNGAGVSNGGELKYYSVAFPYAAFGKTVFAGHFPTLCTPLAGGPATGGRIDTFADLSLIAPPR